MKRSQVTHVGFADESHWNRGRFRSIGLVTTLDDNLETLNDTLRNILKESGVTEFKWKKLDGAKGRFAAEKLCRFAVDGACDGRLRMDVLIWDIEDSRHKVKRRDDIANLQRMYYHLFRNVLRARWPNNAVWRLCPDEHTALDWDNVQDYLDNASVGITVERSLLTRGDFRIRLRKEFGIEVVQPVSSALQPLIQIADLFAGLAVFSRDKFDEYKKWLNGISPQQCLWEEADAGIKPSISSVERFTVLQKFDELCKMKNLGVSLDSGRGLRTYNPENRLNFWLYQPQCPEDKAPQK